MNVGIYIYDGAEVLDFAGPFEVFATASRVCEAGDPFSVFLISETGKAVSARGGVKVIPDYGFSHQSNIDVLIVAGGIHTDEIQKTAVIEWISQQEKSSTIIASVCTGVFLLAQANILQGHKVTTHWQDIPELRSMYPNLHVVDSVRWVDEGNIISSSGMSAGIDMSLHLVSRFHSHELAEKTALQMDYSWAKTGAN